MTNSAVTKSLATFVIVVSAILFCSCERRDYFVQGSSMEPSFRHGDNVILDFLNGKKLKRGDFVIIKSLKTDGDPWLRRVIGMPGETLIWDPKGLAINGKLMELDAVGLPNGQRNFLRAPVKSVLGNDEYFVVGDNLSTARDSREFGPIKLKEIVGTIPPKNP